MPQDDKSGYRRVPLQTKASGSRKVSLAHLALVASGDPRPGPDFDCDHIDGDPKNNSPGNLRWLHRTKHKPNGATKNKPDPTSIGVARFFRDVFGHSKGRIADLLGITRKSASAMLNRETYKHAPEGFPDQTVVIWGTDTPLTFTKIDPDAGPKIEPRAPKKPRKLSWTHKPSR